jgi:hypothetical protein
MISDESERERERQSYLGGVKGMSDECQSDSTRCACKHILHRSLHSAYSINRHTHTQTDRDVLFIDTATEGEIGRERGPK